MGRGLQAKPWKHLGFVVRWCWFQSRPPALPECRFTCNVPWPWPETDLSRIAAMAVQGAPAVPPTGAPAPLALAPAPSQEPLL